MTESGILYNIDSDDDITKMKDIQSPTSALKAKRARLTFPFGAW